MCLAIPSRIVEINDNVATVDVDGVTREASLMLLDNVTIGEYVIVHAGFAIERIHEEVALQTLEDMREMVRLVSKNDEEV